MGNRATVIFTDQLGQNISPVVYLHWNGGPESIYGFLDELDRRRVRTDVDYTAARFIHVVGDYFDGEGGAGSLSLGVAAGPQQIDAETVAAFNPGDNGVYVVTRREAWDEQPLYVRRFTADRGEWTPEQVAAEEQAARLHGYHWPEPGTDSMADVFAKLRPELLNS